jgi:formamidopyrimidine-DNA glycosylase
MMPELPEVEVVRRDLEREIGEAKRAAGELVDLDHAVDTCDWVDRLIREIANETSD